MPSEPPDSVYATPFGQCFHRRDCKFATSATSLSPAEAREAGLRPCSWCVNPKPLPLFVTRAGKSYHRATCSVIKRHGAHHRPTLPEIHERDLKACRLCKPPAAFERPKGD